MVDNITISLTGENGDVITFDNSTYVLTTGVRGFGIPAPLLRIDKSAGNGGVYRFSKRDVRELDLPIVILGDESMDVQTRLRRLSNILRGKVTLTATYSTGEAYELDTYFNGGAETQFGDDANQSYCRWTLTLQAPQPFWTSATPQTFSVAASTATRGLLGSATGFKTLSALRVKSSQALGSVPIENVGDIDSPVTWVIQGPATSVSISLNGVGFSYASSIADGETITIDSELGTVKDSAGSNQYASLGTAPKFFFIPAGTSTVSITAEGADTGTSISGFFRPRREVIH